MIELAAQNMVFRTVLLLLLFGLIVLAVLAIGIVFSNRVIARSQVQKMTDEFESRDRRSAGSLRSKEVATAWTRLAEAIEAAGLNLDDTNQERLSKKMRAAGYMSPSAPRVYTLIRLILVFALPIGYVVLSLFSNEAPSFLKLYLIGSILALLGLFIPSLYVQARADRRQQEITNGFPDCLDLILVCVESGLGIEASIDRVGREMVNTHPLVAELLSLATLQLRAGASREEAFRKVADATSVDDIRSFTTLIIQSDKLGTSIATTLRVYAAEMREKRRMRAEEKAHRLPVLLSIPLVSCMLPTMIGMLMLPAAIMFVRELVPILTR